MKLALKAVALLVAAAFFLPSCGALKRAGTDLAVIATCPVTILLDSAYDALDWGKDTKDATPIVLFPFNFPLHFVKHVCYTVCYAGDLFISPFYLLASITPQRRDMVPIDLYSLQDGYPWKSQPWPSFE